MFDSLGAIMKPFWLRLKFLKHLRLHSKVLILPSFFKTKGTKLRVRPLAMCLVGTPNDDGSHTQKLHPPPGDAYLNCVLV